MQTRFHFSLFYISVSRKEDQGEEIKKFYLKRQTEVFCLQLSERKITTVELSTDVEELKSKLTSTIAKAEE